MLKPVALGLLLALGSTLATQAQSPPRSTTARTTGSNRKTVARVLSQPSAPLTRSIRLLVEAPAARQRGSKGAVGRCARGARRCRTRSRCRCSSHSIPRRSCRPRAASSTRWPAASSCCLRRRRWCSRATPTRPAARPTTSRCRSAAPRRSRNTSSRCTASTRSDCSTAASASSSRSKVIDPFLPREPSRAVPRRLNRKTGTQGIPPRPGGSKARHETWRALFSSRYQRCSPSVRAQRNVARLLVCRATTCAGSRAP